MSDLNVHYREVLAQVGRVKRLRELGAPLPAVESTRRDLALAIARLLHNEHCESPKCDDAGRVLVSLRGLLQPDVSTALSALDHAVAAGVDLGRPLPLSLHRTVAILFACGFVAVERRLRAH
jgi:hypothetical protein